MLVSCPTNHVYDAVFRAAAQAAGVDPALVKAHAAVESNFDPRAYRPEPRLGDASHGLMQLLFSTAAHYSNVTRPTDTDRAQLTGLYAPGLNIPLGARLIADNLAQAGGDSDVAIAAYNEGISRALEDRAQGRAWRTYDPAYVSKVRACWASYAQDFGSPPPPPPVDPSANTEAGGTSPAVLSLLLAGVAALLTWALKRWGGQ